MKTRRYKMKARFREEGGVAMVTAILISAVVLTMSVTAVTVAVHNTDASGNDRRRLDAIDAAEAGVDFYYSHVLGAAYGSILTTAPSTTKQALVTQLAAQGYVLDTTTCVLTGTLGSSSAAFAVTPAFYATSTSATHTACPTTALTSTTPNVYVVLTSIGSLGSLSAPHRTMESQARLSMGATTATFPGAAIYGASCVNLNANVDIYSASGRNDANIYVGSTCSTGPNLSVTTRSQIRGSIYVQGSANVANGKFWARGDLWANNGVTISGGKIDGAAISSTSTVAVSGNTYIGSAKAGSTITVQPPGTIYGTQSPNTSGIGAPPTFPYPTYTTVNLANDFPGVLTKLTCTAAIGSSTDTPNTSFNSWVSGNLYLHLITTSTSPCVVPRGISLPGNLALISNGSITLNTGANFTSTTSHNVYFFSGVGATGGACGDFLANSNSGTGANIKALVYTASNCTATLASNSSFASGQIFSGNVLLNSNSPLTFASVDLPGSQGGSAGSLVDIVYKREITSS
jgi:hypothetical protein